jgi:hypothetical protein
MKRMPWMLAVGLAVFPSACAMEGVDEAELASTEELAATNVASKVQSATAKPIGDALAAATINHVSLADPFEDAEVDEAASTVTAPKPPWPFTCGSLSGNAVSVGFDGPDGGTCTISGTTSNCRQSGNDTCTCDLSGESRAGDCKDDGSKTTFSDPAETQGVGL